MKTTVFSRVTGRRPGPLADVGHVGLGQGEEPDVILVEFWPLFGQFLPLDARPLQGGVTVEDAADGLFAVLGSQFDGAVIVLDGHPDIEVGLDGAARTDYHFGLLAGTQVVHDVARPLVGVDRHVVAQVPQGVGQRPHEVTATCVAIDVVH